MEILPQILTKHNFAEEYDELMIANYKYIGHIFSSWNYKSYWFTAGIYISN